MLYVFSTGFSPESFILTALSIVLTAALTLTFLPLPWKESCFTSSLPMLPVAPVTKIVVSSCLLVIYWSSLLTFLTKSSMVSGFGIKHFTSSNIWAGGTPSPLYISRMLSENMPLLFYLPSLFLYNSYPFIVGILISRINRA